MSHKVIITFLFVYIALAALFYIAGVVAYSIPDSAIKSNVETSFQTLVSELPEDEKRPILMRRDFFTDGLMLQMALFPIQDAESTVSDALLNPYMFDSIGVGSMRTIQPGIEIANLHSTNHYQYVHYGRYWHGYQLPLRICLMLTDIKGIRIINYILLSILVVIVGILLYRRHCGKAITAAYAISFVPFIPLVGSCMQFTTCFYIALFATMFILLFSKQLTYYPRQLPRISVVFFIIGAITSWLDFLTTPILTLGIPLATIVALTTSSYPSLYNKNNTIRLSWLLIICAAWGAGYILLWATKWFLAVAVTGVDIISDALEAVDSRVNDTTMISHKMIIMRYILAIAILIAVIIAVYCYNKGKLNTRTTSLFLIGLLPLIWYVLAFNHSVIHLFFTYRTLIVSTFCWGAIFLHVLRTNHSKNS